MRSFDRDATDLDAFVAENLDRDAETQDVLPERLGELGERYRSPGHLTREQLYEIADVCRDDRRFDRTSVTRCGVCHAIYQMFP